jgi:cyanate lyase
MNRKEIINRILMRLQEAEVKHPGFPMDMVHRVSIMIEEAGEAMRATLQHEYENGSIAAIKIELEQTAAMCIRILESIE